VVVIAGVVRVNGASLSTLSGEPPVAEAYKRTSEPPPKLFITIKVAAPAPQIETSLAVGGVNAEPTITVTGTRIDSQLPEAEEIK
jgi:hypothetical protein